MFFTQKLNMGPKESNSGPSLSSSKVLLLYNEHLIRDWKKIKKANNSILSNSILSFVSKGNSMKWESG